MAMTDGEYDLMEGMEKLAGILTGVAEGFDELAESFGNCEEEIVEINAGKTREEIDLEDAMAAEIAAPIVNALDGITAIINRAAEQVMEMNAGQFDCEEQPEDPDGNAVFEEQDEAFYEAADGYDTESYSGFDDVINRMYVLGNNLAADAVQRMMLLMPLLREDEDE